MKLSVQIMRNVLTNWATYFIGTVIGFLMMPFIIHQLGDVKYGLWILIMNFTGYLGLFDLGVSGSIVKFVAEYKAKNDPGELNRFCSTAFFIYTASGIVVTLIATIIAFFFLSLFKIPPEHLTEARYVTIITGANIGISLVVGFFSGYIRGMQRYDLMAILRLGILIFRSVLIVIFLLMGSGLITLSLIHLGSNMLSALIKFVYVSRTNPDLHISPDLVSREKFRQLAHFSVFVFMYYISSQLIFSTSGMIIGYFISAAAITYYAIPQRLVEWIRLLIMGMSGVLDPSVSHLDARGQTGKIQALLISGTKYSLIITLPIAASFIMVGKEFISLWVSPAHAAASYPVLIILSCAIVAHISQYTSLRILQGIARHKISAYTSICEALANFVLSIILVKPFGITGVAFGTLIPMLCINCLIIPCYTCRAIGLPIRHYVREAYIMPFINVLLFAALLGLITSYMEVTGWFKLITAISISCSAYVLLAWFTCFSRSERAARLGQFRTVFSAGG